MNIDFIKRIVAFAVLCLAQVLILNHINLFGCAVPLLYVHLTLMFRRNYPRWGILLWSFMTGLCIDVFSNTPGLAAASMTMLGLVQPYILQPFIPRDSEDNLKPGIKTLGFGAFTLYIIICVLLYNIVFFSLEAFNFFNWLQWIECIGGSTVLTVILIIVIENMRSK